MDSSVGIIQENDSRYWSSSSIIPKQWWYSISSDENGIWDKPSEAYKAKILSNPKTPHKPTTHFKFHDVTLGDIIKAIYHQIYFGNTNNNLTVHM